MSKTAQLLLLADHIKLSLLERERARSLDLEPSAHDGDIARSLESLREGLETAKHGSSDPQGTGDDPVSDELHRIQVQYSDLDAQFRGDAAAATAPSLSLPNDPLLAADFDAARSRQPQTQQSHNRSVTSPAHKSVRFRDDPSTSSTDENSARNALLPYRDEPPKADDQAELSNQQIHTYHAHVLQEQDEQLDRLGESIGRQRDLSIQIGDELDEHVAMLDEMDEHVDRHQGRLDGARDRIGKIARKANDNKQITTIVVLVIILVLLIIILK